MSATASRPVLEAAGLSVGYHDRPVVSDLDVAVHRGQITALLGPNGAGKTTTLLALAGALRPMAGSVMIDGAPAPASLHGCARHGVAFVPEERAIFREMSVRDNLKVGRCEPARAVALFPELGPLMDQKAGNLSGGEQQMLAIGRAFARGARALLVDELSMGLAPLVVRRILDAVRTDAAESGTAVVLVEQHIRQVMRIADDVIVLRRGQVTLRGEGADLRTRVDEIEESYLGTTRKRTK